MREREGGREGRERGKRVGRRREEKGVGRGREMRVGRERDEMRKGEGVGVGGRERVCMSD